MEDFLKKLGIKTGSFSKIRLGLGIVGKSSHVVFILIIGLASSAYVLEGNWFKLIPIVGMVGAFVYYLHKVLNFSEKHPDSVLLEGAELFPLKQSELAVKKVKK